MKMCKPNSSRNHFLKHSKKIECMVDLKSFLKFPLKNLLMTLAIYLIKSLVKILFRFLMRILPVIPVTTLPKISDKTLPMNPVIKNFSRIRIKILPLLMVVLFPIMTYAGIADSTEIAISADTVTSVSEQDYYSIVDVPVPEGVVLEVGGLSLLPDGKLAVATRRGEIWKIGNPSMAGGRTPYYSKFAEGMYETLGLRYRNGSFYTVQRGELNRLTDTNGDGKADLYERVYAWPLSGHYHEYSYGPSFLPNGNMVVTGNVAFFNDNGAKAISRVPWRGWALIITPEGEMRPYASGMRSPAGVTVNDAGDIFYTDNQGDWIGSGFLSHIEEGDFMGNRASLRWAEREDSPVDVRWDDIVDSERPMYELAERMPGIKLPAVWIPHTLMGTSTSDILQDTEGRISPFKGHYFIGDQGHALINRVNLERVNGEYQGAVFPFHRGFASGVVRMIWGEGESMYVGMTDRGWSSTGERGYGLQRLEWNGEVPFEMKSIKAAPDGFEIEFTKPVNRELAANPAFYKVTNFIYMYRYDYGSPIINRENAPLRGLKISDDGKTVHLAIDNIREKYVHEVKLGAIRSENGTPLLHDVGYYTLNHIPEGEPLAVSDMTTQYNHTHHAGPQITSPVGDLDLEESEELAGEADGVAPAAKRVTDMPSSWENNADRTIRLGTQPGLRFDIEEIELNAGEKIELIFDNDDDMLHNVVIVEPGTADEVGEQAMQLGLDGREMNYVPESASILYHTGILQPGRSETIYFTAPDTPGTYTYVCTFPGHYIIMRGTITVR